MPAAAGELLPALALDCSVRVDGPEPIAAEAQRGSPSGVLPGGPDSADPSHDELAEFLVHLRPYYRQSERESERAPPLDLEDLSLRPDNPYLASSLLPSPSPTRWLRASALQMVAITAIATMAGTSAFFLWRGAHASDDTSPLHGAPAPAAASLTRPLRVARAPNAALGAPRAALPSTLQVLASTTAARAPSRTASTPALSARPLARAIDVERDHARAQTPSTPNNTRAAPSRDPSVTSKALRSGPAREPAPPSQTAPVEPAVEASPEPTNAPTPLPRLPTPKAVKSGFEQIHGLLGQCAVNKHGLVTIHATIGHDGRISGASVDGVFDTTQERSCMAGVILTARFPAFSQSSFRVSYPLML